MGTLNLQTLVSGTAQALMEASASDYYQRVFKTLGRQLLIYADTHETDGFSMDFGLQFLEDHYSSDHIGLVGSMKQNTPLYEQLLLLFEVITSSRGHSEAQV